MRTLKRIMTVCVVVAMLMSMTSVISFADTTNDFTLSASKTTVKPGDEITLSVSFAAGGVNGLTSFQYLIGMDNSVFDYDETENPDTEEMNVYGADWMDDSYELQTSKKTNKKFETYKYEAKKVAVDDSTKLSFTLMASKGSFAAFEAADATAWEEIGAGVYNLKIKDNATPGTYTIAALPDATRNVIKYSGGNERAIVINSLEITVEAAGPTLESIAADKTTVGIARLENDNEDYYLEEHVDTAKVAAAIAKNLNVTATYSDNSTVAVAYKTGLVTDGFEITDITLNSEDYIDDGGNAKVSYAGKTIDIAFTMDKFVSSEIEEQTADYYLAQQYEPNQKDVQGQDYKAAPAGDEDQSPVVVSAENANPVKGSRFDMNSISANLYSVIAGSEWADEYKTSVSRFFFTVNNYDGLGDAYYETGAIAFKIASDFDSFDFAEDGTVTTEIGVKDANEAIKNGEASKGDSNIFFIDVTAPDAASTDIYAKPFIIVYNADGEIDHIIWDDQMIKNNCNTVYTYKVEDR